MAASSWLIGCTVSNGYTTAEIFGAGIEGGNASNCIVERNLALAGGGADGVNFYNSRISKNSAGQGGGGRNCNFYGCTVDGNTASYDGGGGYYSYFENSISWGNSTNDSPLSNFYSCGVGYIGPGSIATDPLFVSTADVRLTGASPCINAGTNKAWTTGATDLDGNPRIYDNYIVDMGAYEYQGYPPPPQPRYYLWVKP